MASQPNSWEPVKVKLINSIGNAKLKLTEDHDTILAEEVHRRDSVEVPMSSSALIVENRRRGF